MLFTYGKNTVVKNIARIMLTRFGRSQLNSFTDLGKLMKQFLETHQPMCPVNFDRPLVNGGTKNGFLNKSFKGSRIDDLFQEKIIGSVYPESKVNLYAEKVYSALDKINDLDPEIRKIFEIYINEITIQKSGESKDGKKALGGTSSKSIGKIWFAPQDFLTVTDYIELLAHELTHNLVFVDELNYGYFEYKNMGKEEYYAKSAILNRNRPMDKVFHSIVVAAEIIQWRENFLYKMHKATVHPETSKIKSSILTSISSIYENPKAYSLLKDRPKEILEKVHTAVSNLSERKRALCS